MSVLAEIRHFASVDEGAKRAIRDGIGRDRSWVIVGWAEGMASLAVRTGRRDYLCLGLVGLSLFDASEFDARDALIVYPLFVRAAELLGESPDQIAREAAQLTDSMGADWILKLLPSNRHATQATHTEMGQGPDFAFKRRVRARDAESELADFVEGDPLS
jgi:hypothetical protein